ncbi:MAG: glycosyltransferase family 1 protein [Breznakibacter sp.]
MTQKITGVQRYAVELCSRLKKQRDDLIFVAPVNILDENKIVSSQLGVKCFGSFEGHLWEQIDLPLFLKKNGSPLLLNLCNTAPLLYGNKVSTIHDLAFLYNPLWFSVSFRWFYRVTVPRIAKSSIHIITVSQFSKQELLERFRVDKDKISVIYNAVDKRFHCDGLNSRDRFVLFVGSNDPRKNMSSLIEAFRYLPKDIHLKIVGGSGASFNNNQQDLVNLPNIDFLGYVSEDELIKYYCSANCFVYPSLYEGFGLPPLEAQAAGIPIAVSSIAVFKEIFGQSALYFNPIDPKSIAESIVILTAMDSKEKIQFVQKGIVNSLRFSWDFSTTQISLLLDELG